MCDESVREDIETSHFILIDVNDVHAATCILLAHTHAVFYIGGSLDPPQDLHFCLLEHVHYSINSVVTGNSVSWNGRARSKILFIIGQPLMMHVPIAASHLPICTGMQCA